MRYSDDAGSAKNGGVLPWFGTGKMVPEFEDAALHYKTLAMLVNQLKQYMVHHQINRKETVPTFEESKDDLERKLKEIVGILGNQKIN